jgi:hypothetical protein
MKTLKQGLMKANKIMESMVNHQVMSLAPPAMRDSYFEEVFESIKAQATIKRLKLQLENEKLRWKDLRRNRLSCRWIMRLLYLHCNHRRWVERKSMRAKEITMM